MKRLAVALTVVLASLTSYRPLVPNSPQKMQCFFQIYKRPLGSFGSGNDISEVESHEVVCPADPADNFKLTPTWLPWSVFNNYVLAQ